MYAIKHRQWENPESSIYNDHNGPDKVINRCMKSSRLIYYQFNNRKKRRKDYQLISIETLRDKMNSDIVELEDTSANLDDCSIDIHFMIEQTFKRKEFFLAFILDCICIEDVFDKTNLNRQIRSNLDTINKSKVEVTAQEAKKINPDINIKTYEVHVTEDNISEILQGNEVLIDAVDNVYTRVLISREAKKQDITFIHSAVDETSGQLTIIDKNTPSYEELFKLDSLNKPLEDSKDYLLNISSKKPQVLGVTPAIFGSLEVSETIKYILGRENTVLSPNVLMWDIFDINSFRIIEF